MDSRHLLTPALDPPGTVHGNNRLVSEIHVEERVGGVWEYSLTSVR